MVFHEIYGSYYHTVSLVLKEAVNGTLTRKSMSDIIKKNAFEESFLSIPDGLTGERWRLLHKDLTTPLSGETVMPLTLLQKRWMKALLLDPRIQLFDPDPTGLEGITPLFTPDMFVYYDRYSNGDNYQDAEYIANFRTVLTALEDRKNLSVRYESRNGICRTYIVTPHHLEFSEKDDRFRLYAAGEYQSWTLNLSKIRDCSLIDAEKTMELHPKEEQMLRFELVDERNTLERVLLHFSHLRKQKNSPSSENGRERGIFHPFRMIFFRRARSNTSTAPLPSKSAERHCAIDRSDMRTRYFCSSTASSSETAPSAFTSPSG